MKIAICEDVQADADKLTALVRQYCAENLLEADIDCFASARSLLASYLPGSCQILLLDILMDGPSGMDAARAIRQVDPEVAIILVTASRDFAVESYLVDAAFYLVKPVDRDGLAQAMERCRSVLRQHAATISVLHNRKPVELRLRDILYLESKRNNCILYTRQGEISTRALLSAVEPSLGGLPFLRCHTSFIINLLWAEDMVERDFLLKNGAKIPISKAYLPAVQREFNRYLMDYARGNRKDLPSLTGSNI